MTNDLVKASKFLSLVLRHQPQHIGLALDLHGWADLDELVERANAHGMPLTREIVMQIVETSDKRRFALDERRMRIRASQGHSIGVELGLEPSEPPSTLFHGTAAATVAAIRIGGLQRGRRQHVHLSPDRVTATKVGRRHGRPVVLDVRAGALWAQGAPFFCSANGVWLTPAVPPEFITFPAEET